MQNKEEIHPEDRRNLMIFGVVSVLVWVGFNHFILQPRLERLHAAQVAAAQHPSAAAVEAAAPLPRADVLAESPRVKIDNGSIFGSLALKGGRIDDLSLQRYYTTLAKTDHVQLLSPAGTAQPEYLEFGWVASDKAVPVPDQNSVWQLSEDSAKILTADNPVTMTWDNGRGLRFTRKIAIDKDYLMTVSQAVTNTGKTPVTLSPFGLVSEHGLPDDLNTRSGRVFEGAEAYLDGSLQENTYAALVKKPVPAAPAETGWIGVSQKYWFTGLIPAQTGQKIFRYIYTPSNDPDDAKKVLGQFQVDVTGNGQTVAPGATVSDVTRVFAGAKELNVLEDYATSIPVKHFDLVVDFGLYYFLTKPFFYILDFFGHLTGNFGIAIIILTVLVRLAVFPLANISFRSFAKMKKISPRLKELRDEFGGDKAKLQEALVKLYEKEKVNPMAGCFPLVLQIPIFFALYKVLSVTIELRQAPFFGWIHDLSAPDPTTVFNLFGLIPWQPPQVLMLGGWSCMMLIAMLAQRRLNPPSQDTAQQISQNLMPFFVTFIMAKFPAGLVIYWTFSNTLSVVQQYVIMRSMGVEVSLIHRSKADKDMARMVENGPDVHPGLIVAEDEVEQALFGKTVSKPKPKKKKKKK